jgi:hypothetical protein
MNDFENTKYLLVRNFLEPQAAQTVSRYMEYAVNQGLYTGNILTDCSKYSCYADPLMETILYNSQADVETLTGKKLYPTYSFSRVYVKGDELKPHVDRPSCEISVTCHVASVGAPWPIWMQAPGKEPVSFTLEPGDAVIYRGCDVTHWREKAINTDINAQFMLHYVDQNGPNASYKFDRRQALGIKQKGI